MADDDAGKPPVLKAALKLGKPSRWAAFVLGLAGMGVGGLAAFKANLEAPPVALLAAGLVLALVGLSGVMPTRLKIGDNEAEWLQEKADLAGVLVQQVATASGEDKSRVAEIVDRVADVAPEVAQPAQSAFRFEQSILLLLTDLALELPGQTSIGVDHSPQAFDGLIVLSPDAEANSDRERHILLDIKQRLTRAVAHRVMDNAARYAVEHPDVDTTVLVVSKIGKADYDAVEGMYVALVGDSAERNMRQLRKSLAQAVKFSPVFVFRGHGGGKGSLEDLDGKP